MLHLNSRNAGDFKVRQSFCSIWTFFHLGHHLLLTFHRAEDHSFNWHKLLANETLATARAQETLCGCVPVKAVVAHTLNFGVNCIVATLADLVNRQGNQIDHFPHVKNLRHAPCLTEGECNQCLILYE